MTFFDFIPLALIPMSVLTAITFFFCAVGFRFFYTEIKKELMRINIKLSKNETDISDVYKDLNRMKTDIALLLQSSNRIEKLLERR